MALKVYGESSSKSTAKYVTLGGFTKMGEKNPESFTGRYLGTLEGPNQFEKGKTKTVFAFEDEDGQRVYVNGNTRLISTMKNATGHYEVETGLSAVGALCQINYLGMEKLDGGKTIKSFSVAFDAEDHIDVIPVENYSDKADVESEESQPAVVPAVSASAKRAKVEELLNRRKAN